MSFNSAGSGAAIKTVKLSKCYQLYPHPKDRLKQFLWPHRWWGSRQYYRELWALRDIDLTVMPGEVIGIVGQNGSGKSTLLQLVCSTLTPTHGEVQVTGRVAALLELGAGFNPEFTGRENVLMSAAIMGLSSSEIAHRIEDIIDFSGVRDFIDQPVKTYSSGMYVRLAFSVATSVDPQILVIDEALSVGDGKFARKSFDRIRTMKEMGNTILFCSHSLYQIEAFCDRVLWLDHGKLVQFGNPQDVLRDYKVFLLDNKIHKQDSPMILHSHSSSPPQGHARLNQVKVKIDDKDDPDLEIVSGKNEVSITVSFMSDPTLPSPTIAGGFMEKDGRVICSASTHFDRIILNRTSDGYGEVELVFPKLPLLKGNYWIAVYLLCENGIHIYDYANFVAEIKVRQTNTEQGIVSLPHLWKNRT